MKYISISSLILVGIWNFAIAEVGSNVWTLECSIEAAFENSPQLHRSGLAIARARSEATEFDALRKGSFEAGASYNYVSEVMEADLNLPLPPGSSPPKLKFGDGNSYDLVAGVRLPLYSGGALRLRSEAGHLGVEAALKSAAMDSLNLVLRVRTAYWSAVGADLRVQAITHSLDRMNSRADEIKRQIVIGASSNEALLAVKSRVAQLEASLAAAEGDAAISRLQFGMIVTQRSVEIYPADTTGDDVGVDWVEGPDSTAVIRPDQASMQIQIEQARKNADALGSAFLPSINASAAYHYGKPGINAIENEWMGYATTGLNLTWTIWDWGVRDKRQEKAVIQKKILQVGLNEQLTATQSAARTARTKLLYARAAAKSESTRLDLLRERHSLIVKRMSLGAATETELLDAEEELSQAEIDLISTKIKINLAQAELSWADGRNLQ